MIRTLTPTRRAEARADSPAAEAPARVSPRQLPAVQDVGWLMVNLGLLTLLLGVLTRLF